jgi:hypothetical protein
MTGSPLPRALARLLTLAVAAVSGAYLIVYLYRWEWNRALISGLFFLVAEIAYIGSSLRSEIAALRARIDAFETRAGPARPEHQTAPAARPSRSFAWLRESASGHMSVFVPVLLGAGVILSALAFVVERVAGIVARPATGRVPTRRLFALDTPPGGLLGPVPEPDAAGRRRARFGTQGRLPRVIAAVVLVLILVAAIDIVADATQSRPSPRVPGTSTVVELAIDQRRPRPAIEAAEALAVACHGTLHADSEFTEIATIRIDHVRLEVTPALSEPRRRRLFGCLQDATLDLVQAHVVTWSTVPTPAPRGDGDTDPAV